MASILTILLISLSVAPCADACSHEPGARAEQTEHQDDNHNTDQEGHADECSPLCYCHCCHTSVIMSTQEFRWFDVAHEHAYSNSYKGFNSEAHFNSLFRPPIG